MTRIENWERLLADALETARGRPFIWGRHDCATWAFELRCNLSCGADHAAHWRGRYSTALGAARVMRRLGWASPEEMGRALLGAPLATTWLAQRGDLVLAVNPEAFGIVTGAQASFVSLNGLVSLPLAACCLAWRT